jgi:tricorn protease interacting factor F2/3
VLYLEIQPPSSVLRIHAGKEVKINKIIREGTEIELSWTKGVFDIWEVDLQALLSGSVQLHVWFTGTITTENSGCYISHREGQKMIITHFEPTFARKALPCLDEPGFKSQFDLTIQVDSEWNVISNMPGLVNTSGLKKRFIFETTPLMSIYLLHWTICKHSFITRNLDEVKVSLYAEDTQFSAAFLDLAVETLDYYNRLFSIPYPLPKMDLISVFSNLYPAMSVRAMENWGCITFHRSCLEHLPSEGQAKFIRDCRTVCHEISHMWFGNLVTMAWWTDLWLNEGFARFMEFKCLNKIRPEFEPWLRFVTDVLYQALKMDFPFCNSHPVEITCVDPGNVNKYFDSISYLKGASVLRMMEKIMGEECFDRAIREYLDRFKWKNVSSEDFFKVMDEFSDRKVSEIMQTWTKQVGFPLVTVKKESSNCFSVKQETFDKGYLSVWTIPLRFVDNVGEVREILMEESEMAIESEAKWIKLNYASECFYRVLYANYEEIFEDAKKLNVEDRYGLVNDALFNYKTGNVSIAYVLSLVRGIIPEYEYSIVCEVRGFLLENIQKRELTIEITELLTEFLLPLWNRYKLDSDSENSDLDSLKVIYIGDLIETCKCESVAKEYLSLIQDKENNENYFQCLIALKDSQETFELAKTSKSFANAVLASSNDNKLLKEASRNILHQSSEESYQFIHSFLNTVTIRNRNFIEDELIKVLILEVIEEENEEIVSKLEKLLIEYYFNIMYKEPKMIRFLDECSEYVKKKWADVEVKQVMLLKIIEDFRVKFENPDNFS